MLPSLGAAKGFVVSVKKRRCGESELIRISITTDSVRTGDRCDCEWEGLSVVPITTVSNGSIVGSDDRCV